MAASLIAHHFTILLLHIWLIFLILGFAFNFLNLLEGGVHWQKLGKRYQYCLLSYIKAKNHHVQQAASVLGQCRRKKMVDYIFSLFFSLPFFQKLCIFDSFGTLVFAVFMGIWGKLISTAVVCHLILAKPPASAKKTWINMQQLHFLALRNSLVGSSVEDVYIHRNSFLAS